MWNNKNDPVNVVVTVVVLVNSSTTTRGIEKVR